MNKFSKNNKLNSVLLAIEESLLDMNKGEIRRYMEEFPGEVDYNLYKYGKMLISYNELRNLYLNAGYKCENWSCYKLERIYMRLVGYVARMLMVRLQKEVVSFTYQKSDGCVREAKGTLLKK